ncbi:MAG: transporter substrate-binding domain-containing protein [Kordiimonadaceae bacterium]|nr:transporter substrate-binding domain-containing protein [Kordiimonadaceae bacterium]
MFLSLLCFSATISIQRAFIGVYLNNSTAGHSQKKQGQQLLHYALAWSLFIALVCFIPQEAHAGPRGHKAELKTITIGYVNIPPYAYSKNGKPAGVINDLTQQIMERLPYKYTLKQYPVKRLFQLLKTGKVHVWLRGSTPTIADPGSHRGELSILQAKVTIYSSAPFTAPPWQDITGPVIYVQGYTYQGLRRKLEETRPDITFIGSPTHLSGFKMLQAGRAKYMLNYALPAGEAIRKLAMTNIHSVHISDVPVNFYVSKKAPNAKFLLQELETAYLALPAQASGE